MAKNYSSSTLSVWRKSLNIVHSIVAPIFFIWKQQYFKVIAVVNAACEKINVSFVSLRKGFLKRKKSLECSFFSRVCFGSGLQRCNDVADDHVSY